MSSANIWAQLDGEGIRLTFYGGEHYFTIEAAQDTSRELFKPRHDAVPFFLEGEQQFLGTDTRKEVAEALFDALAHIPR